MLSYNEITEHKVIIMDGNPFEVLSSHVFRKQQRKPVNATKLKNILTGKVTEYSFHASDKVEEVEIETKNVKYLYNNRGEWWFCEIKDPSKRFEIDELLIGDAGKFLKENSIVQIMIFKEKIIGVKLPIKVDLKVKEAHPTVRGNTARSGSKMIVLETGAEIQVPMFVKEGDIVRINTETGQYTDRVS
ncbi:MAG TPA: elongation factor P [Candidatus Paceibacterota bacterium]